MSDGKETLVDVVFKLEAIAPLILINWAVMNGVVSLRNKNCGLTKIALSAFSMPASKSPSLWPALKKSISRFKSESVDERR